MFSKLFSSIHISSNSSNSNNNNNNNINSNSSKTKTNENIFSNSSSRSTKSAKTKSAKHTTTTNTTSPSQKVVIVKTKKVRFCKVVQQILIYSRSELNESKLLPVLFYSRDDIKKFHDNAVNEIDEYRFSEACLSKRNHLVASGIMYDPQHIGDHNNERATTTTFQSEIITPPSKSEISQILFKKDSILLRDEPVKRRSLFGRSRSGSSSGSRSNVMEIIGKIASSSSVSNVNVTPTSPSSTSSSPTSSSSSSTCSTSSSLSSCSTMGCSYSFPVYGLHASPADECSVAVAAIVMYQPIFEQNTDIAIEDDFSYFK